jgi:hypothetical protein
MTATDPTVPAIPTPPKLTRLTTARPVRVAFEYNVTPIFSPAAPNDKGERAYYRSTEMQEYLLARGFEAAMMVSNGTENRAMTWHDGQNFRAIEPGQNGYSLNFDLEGNFCNPLDPAAARAVAALANDPTHFGAKVNPLLPIFLDVEQSNAYTGPCDTPEQAAALIANWTTRLTTYRTLLGTDFEIYAYYMMGFAGRPALANRPDLQEADRAMMRLLTGYVAGLYAWEQTAGSPGSWFKQVDDADARVSEYYPFLKHNRWATINPCYQMLNGTRAGEPVSLEFWKSQLRYLADRGWNVFVFCGGTELKPVKGHLDAAAKYAMAGVN